MFNKIFDHENHFCSKSLFLTLIICLFNEFQNVSNSLGIPCIKRKVLSFGLRKSNINHFFFCYVFVIIQWQKSQIIVMRLLSNWCALSAKICFFVFLFLCSSSHQSTMSLILFYLCVIMIIFFGHRQYVKKYALLLINICGFLETTQKHECYQIR